MKLIPYLALLIRISGIITTTGHGISVSKFYEDITFQQYNCSVTFKEPMFFDCACVTGLWILYDSCSESAAIAGDNTERCVKLVEAPVSKAVQVVSNREELAVVDPNGRVALLQPKIEKAVGPFKSGSAMVTGSNWTLIDTSGTRVCASVVKPDTYCFFTQLENLQLKVNRVEKGCDQQADYFIEPQRCETISGKRENICESRLRTSKHTLVKRQADDGAGAPAPAKSEESSSEADKYAIPNDDDEDYQLTHNNSSNPITLVADEILDFMNIILDDLLDLQDPDFKNSTAAVDAKGSLNLEKDLVTSSDRNPLNITYANPPYEFLEVSKRITQRTCPSFYVKPSFLDLAVATFIQLQQVRFKFPETSFKPPGFRRVLQYLRKCEQHVSKFKFTDADCDGKVDGNYTAFDKEMELTITSDYADRNRDPIIETVWKIFYNAHSYCYPFFEKPLDHHRFTTWMTPLFQNQINDIWNSGKITENFFNGVFGNQVKVQENLAYCAVSSRLESTYPFDLPRPTRVAEYGPSLLKKNEASSEEETTAPADTKERRKRDTYYTSFLRPVRFGICLDASKPLLCPDHVKYIAN